MKKEHKIIFIIMIGIPILLLFLDLGEIRKIIPVTDNYDWLSFIGSCLSAFGALMLGLLAMRQNESLKELNKKMQDDNKIVNCYSIIDLMKVNYIDYRELLATDYYGSVLKKKDEINIEKNYQRFIFHIFDKKGIPLKYIKFNKIVIEPNYESNYSNRRERESHTYYYQSEEYTELELSPSDNNAYYAPVYIEDKIEIVKKFNLSGKLRITIDSTIINSFNVAMDSEIVLLIIKTGGIHGDWQDYNLSIRKIYYGDVYVADFTENAKIVKHDY